MHYFSLKPLSSQQHILPDYQGEVDFNNLGEAVHFLAASDVNEGYHRENVPAITGKIYTDNGTGGNFNFKNIHPPNLIPSSDFPTFPTNEQNVWAHAFYLYVLVLSRILFF